MSGAPAAQPSHVLSVLLEDRLVTFTRAVGLLRRRRIPAHSIAVGPASASGLSRLTVLLRVDAATAERGAQYLRKVVGVRDAVVFPTSEESSRELALIKVRVPASGDAELLDVAQLYRCTVVDETASTLMLEVCGPPALVLSCLRALERFGVVEVARTGTVALDTTTR